MKTIYKTMITLLLLAFIPFSSLAAQMVCQLGQGFTQYNPAYDSPPTQKATIELQMVYKTLCPGNCGYVALVQNPTIPNAALFSFQPGNSKMVYSAPFMNQIFNQFGPVATLGIIAHEFGHHLDFMQPAAWMSNSWSKELRADAWAGCFLGKQHLDPTQLQNSLQAIATYPSPTHPAWPQRWQALQTGYQYCGGSGYLPK